MKSTLNKTDEVNGTILIELEKADYQENVNKSLNKFRQSANIPGFRQGKVPKSVIQKMYGKSVLAEEINKLVGSEIENFIRENQLKVLGEPIPNTSEDKQVDLDKDENFKFYFDVALTPEFNLKFDKEVEQIYYSVELEENLLNKQIDTYKQNYGTYFKVEEEALDTDLIKGTLTEVDDGKDTEDGKVIENAILMPSYLKDKEVKNKFVGVKVGDSVIFNPKTAYDNNEAEVASLLQTTKEEIAEMNSDFRFDILEVTRYREAEINQELFDRVLGPNIVTTEEDFREKIKEGIERQFKPNADHLFIHEMRDRIVDMMSDVKFPDEFLKRWLLESNKEQTADKIEEDYPKILEDLKFHVVKQKIIEENDIKVEYTDIQSIAEEVAGSQFAQYGMTNIPDDVLKNYTKSMLENEETVQNLFDKANENKVIDWLKENITVVDKKVSTEEFNKIMEEHSHLHDEHSHDQEEDDFEGEDEETPEADNVL